MSAGVCPDGQKPALPDLRRHRWLFRALGSLRLLAAFDGEWAKAEDQSGVFREDFDADSGEIGNQVVGGGQVFDGVRKGCGDYCAAGGMASFRAGPGVFEDNAEFR